MNRRELLRELSRVQATWVNRNTPGAGDVNVTAEQEQDYLTRIAAVFDRARQEARRKRPPVALAADAVAARAAIDMLLAFDPGQKRGKGGRWVETGGGRRATASENVKLPAQPPVKVAPRGSVFAEGWMDDADPAERAKGFWQGRFHDQRKIREVFRNIAAGKSDPTEGVDVDRGFGLTYLRVEPPGQPDDTAERVYDKEDLRNELTSAARWLHESLADAPVTRQPLYRGMRMKRAEVPKVGESWESDVISWAEERFWAEHYAEQREDPGLGRVGDTEVVFRLNGPKRSVDLGPGYLDEHITQGRYRVTRVTGTGRRRFVTVEEVPEDE